MSYPKWLYHKSELAKIVHSESEESALGKGWADSPAEFEQSPVEQKSDEESEKPAKSPRKSKKDAE